MMFNLNLRPGRYAAFAVCVLLLAAFAAGATVSRTAWFAVAIFAGLVALGLWDLLQQRHSILRLYPGQARASP